MLLLLGLNTLLLSVLMYRSLSLKKSTELTELQTNGQALLLKQEALLTHLEQLKTQHTQALDQLLKQHTLHKEQALSYQHQLKTHLSDHQLKQLTTLQQQLQQSFELSRQQLSDALAKNHQILDKRMQDLNQTTEKRLSDMTQQVEHRLTKGFEKTTETFTEVVKRLALIDEAQKKITELSSNVVSLQDILNDKRSRGAFGEIQLESLIRNVLPESHFSFQHTFSNKKRVDCLLKLPKPTGNLPIDAKFPLEGYQAILDTPESTAARQQFKQDIKKHIQDVSEKYIIPGETAEGAVLFIPAEAIFSEIHAHHTDLVQFAHQKRVWLVSPTTMMAIITTAKAVIRDDATREQVHLIQKHLQKLGTNFRLFQERMEKLALHIRQANTDVEKIHVSARKIGEEFDKIQEADWAHAEEEVAETIE